MFRSLVLAALLSAAPLPAGAHHSFSLSFDMTRKIELRGTVIDFTLRSPHSLMVIEGRQYVDGRPVGEPERWEIESFARGSLSALGITRDTFKPGDSVALLANPNHEDGVRFVNSSTFWIVQD